MLEEFDNLKAIYNTIFELLINYSFQVVGAIFIFIIGLVLANWLSGLVLRICEKNNLDVTLRLFVAKTTKLVLLTFIIIICLGKFGISVAPFVAAIGALSLGAGFALQGLVSNFGAGFSIILMRPFVVGNTICIQGNTGVVEEINLSTTQLSTEDGELITIPNKHIVGEILQNSFEYKVVELVIRISYQSDPEDAIHVIVDTLKQFPGIPSAPDAQVWIQEFLDPGIAMGIRYWVPTKSYFKTQYKVNLAIYQALKKGRTQPLCTESA